MAETMKERKDMDPQYMWDLSTLFKNDEEWNNALPELDEMIKKLPEYQGKLNNAKTIREFFDFDTHLGRKLSDFYCYASLRNCEDTRDSDAQAMEAKSVSGLYKLTQQQSALLNQKILSLDEEVLESIVHSEDLKPYAFNMQKLLGSETSCIKRKRRSTSICFTETLGAPSKISGKLQDADMTFESVTDSNGEVHELNQSNYILFYR